MTIAIPTLLYVIFGTEKQFKEMVEGMASAKDWTLRSWKAVIDKQLNSWVMYIPGMSSSNEMKSVKTFKSKSLFLWGMTHCAC